VCKRNPDLDSLPEELRLPVGQGQIEAARVMLRENKGAEWSVCYSSGILVGDYEDLRNNLIFLLIESPMPTSTIFDMFGLSGGERSLLPLSPVQRRH
jgi:hypothetical protein